MAIDRDGLRYARQRYGLGRLAHAAVWAPLWAVLQALYDLADAVFYRRN